MVLVPGGVDPVEAGQLDGPGRLQALAVQDVQAAVEGATSGSVTAAVGVALAVSCAFASDEELSPPQAVSTVDTTRASAAPVSVLLRIDVFTGVFLSGPRCGGV